MRFCGHLVETASRSVYDRSLASMRQIQITSFQTLHACFSAVQDWDKCTHMQSWLNCSAEALGLSSQCTIFWLTTLRTYFSAPRNPGMLSPRGRVGLEAKFYGLDLVLGLIRCGLVLVHLGLMTSIIRKSMEIMNCLPRFQCCL